MNELLRLPAGTALRVALQWDLADVVQVGRLGLRGRDLLFEFDPAFVRAGVEIAPLMLPCQPGLLQVGEPHLDHLPGVLADSLPDGWGRLLLDRFARQRGIDPRTLTPLDRLAHVGHDGIGALTYTPELGKTSDTQRVDLPVIARASQAILSGSSDQWLDRLRRVGGSPQGARPKALLQQQITTGELTDAPGWQGPGWRHLLVKFLAPNDAVDAGAVEFAYAQMALAAGLAVPEVHLLSANSGPGYFAATRFDRSGHQRLHATTAAGLLHADFRLPSLDYTDLVKLTLRLTADSRQVERMYRQMVFAVLAHNRDDHAKQFSFLMDRAGNWRLSPAYDLTFSSGPGGEHSTSVAGEGRAPGRAHFRAVAKVGGLAEATVNRIEGEVRDAISRWPAFAAQAGVGSRTTAEIATALRQVAV